jgi:hypothetical protein
MKNFFYFDTDFLHSFIAQEDDGFATVVKAEKLYSHMLGTANEEVVETSRIDGGLNAVVATTKGELTEQIKHPTVNTSITQNAKELITKRQSDDIFNRFEDKIKDDVKRIEIADKATGETNIEYDDIGKYISGHIPMSFFCFSRIESLFSAEYKKIYELGTKNKETFEIFEEIREHLSFLKAAIPYDVFLCSGNLFIPLKEEYLRGDKLKIGFSFERKINVVGRVNKQIQETYDEKPRVIKTLNEMQNVAFSMLYKYGFVKTEQPFIVNPIAVYL